MKLTSLMRFDVSVSGPLLASLAELADLPAGDHLKSGDASVGGVLDDEGAAAAVGAMSPLLEYLELVFRRLAEERKVAFFTPVITSAAPGEDAGEEADVEGYVSAIALAFNTGLHTAALDEIVCVASVNKDFDPSLPTGLARTPNPRWYPLGFTTVPALGELDSYMGIPGDGFPTMNRIGLAAVTTGVLPLATAKLLLGAEHSEGSRKTIGGMPPLRFHVPDKVRRALCFDADARRLPKRLDTWSGMPAPLQVLFPQLPLEVSAEELDVLPLLGVDAAELRKIRAAGGPQEDKVSKAIRGLQESVRGSIVEAHRRACFNPHSALPGLVRGAHGSDARLLLLLPVTLPSALARDARIVIGLALSERRDAPAGVAGAFGEGEEEARFVYAVGAVLNTQQATASARVLQPLLGTWLQPLGGSEGVAAPAAAFVPAALSVAPAASAAEEEAAAAAAAVAAAAVRPKPLPVFAAPAPPVAAPSAVPGAVYAPGAGGKGKKGKQAAAAAATPAAPLEGAAAVSRAAAAAVSSGFDDMDCLFRKSVVASVVIKADPKAAAVLGAPPSAGKPASIKLEVRDEEAVEMLLLMTPPELQLHPHFVALRSNRVLQLGWDRAQFVASGESVTHPKDKEALLENAAARGDDVIATLVSLDQPFRLIVSQVKFH